MNKKEFVEEVAKRCMLTSYVVEEVFNVSFGVISENLLRGQKVEIPKLGSFSTRERRDTEYKNLFAKALKSLRDINILHFKWRLD